MNQTTDLVIPGGLDTGLEDFDAGDMVMPRLAIVQQEAVFEDSLSGEKFAEMDVVILGLIKQRVLWPSELGENDSSPLCKSTNYTTGYPNPSTFPWAESGFSPQDGQQGSVTLSCNDCALKEWGSHPTNNVPWCSEQYTFALLRPTSGGHAPAIVTFQRSGVKSCKTYLTSFAQAKTPLFTCVTKISLEARKRGSVSYAVPKFVKGAETPQELWGEFAQQYRDIRDFLQKAPSYDSADSPAPGGAAAQASSNTPTAPEATPDSSDLPF